MNQALRWIGIAILLSGSERSAIAQVAPDSSGSTAVSQTHGVHFVITGGQEAGTHLFHHFDQFSVPAGGSADFQHSPNIETIFSRVTGDKISAIDGLLVAGADLYLLNPQGILLGPNAALQLKGNFVASTAEQVQFADGLVWGDASREVSLDSSPLLSLNNPVGLQLGADSGDIRVQARGGDDGAGNALGLAVAPGRNLSLIGREVTLEQGVLTAPGGLISLLGSSEGSIALADGAVEPAQLNVPLVDGLSGGAIRLEQGAWVRTSGDGGNGIRLLGDRVTLAGQSRILADNLGITEGQGITVNARRLEISEQSLLASSALHSGRGGAITLRADEVVKLMGTGYTHLEQTLVLSALARQSSLAARDRLTGLVTGGVATGDSGAITVTVPQLQLGEGAAIWAPSFGSGQGGAIELQVPSWFDHQASAIASSAYGSGKAGDLAIETNRFDITQSAFLNTSTFSPASGGSVNIQAKALTLSNPLPHSVIPNAIFSSSIGSTGTPGDITISSQSLLAEAGSQITSTGGVELSIASINAGGPGGNVAIEAQQQIVLRGSGAFQPTQLSVTSYSDFPAGSLTIQTPRLLLEDGARLLATSNVGEGGNIAIEAKEILLLRNGSDITATATGVGNGGNIALDAKQLLLLDNSRVTANSTQGVGGTIDISGRLLLRSPDSSITASSALGKGFGGRVQLNQAQVDPAQAAPSLPKALVASDQERVAATCDTGEGEQFIISGRGGLPPDAWHALGSPSLWQDERSQALLPQPPFSQSTHSFYKSAQHKTPERPLQRSRGKIGEAIAFQHDVNGQIALVPYSSQQNEPAPQGPLSEPLVCQR